MRGASAAFLCALLWLGACSPPPAQLEPPAASPTTAGAQGQGPQAISLPATAEPASAPVAATAVDDAVRRPQLALVMDDLGFRRDRVQQLLALGLTMTYAVLPAEPRTTEIHQMLQDARVPVIVHMPMEPRGFPQVQPGPCALLLAEPESWEATLRDCTGRVPAAQGLNNHMGSALTEHREAMDVLARFLAGRTWFFLDSLTSGKSVAGAAMRQAGVPVVQRDVFLDDDRDATMIAAQWQRALVLARRRGAAVVIGHPYPETLQVLRQSIERGDLADIELVPVQQLARYPDK